MIYKKFLRVLSFRALPRSPENASSYLKLAYTLTIFMATSDRQYIIKVNKKIYY